MTMDQLLFILKAFTGNNADPENASSSIANNNNNLQMPNTNSQIIIGNQANTTPGSSTSLLDHMTQFQSNTSQPIVNIPSNNNTNPILNNCFPVMANTPNQLPSGNFNSNCGGIDQSDMVSPIQNQLINLNLQNTFMGGLQHLNFNTPIDHINSPASSTTFSTQSSSSSPSSSGQEISDNSSSLTIVQKKKKKKIAKANKMRETMSVGYNSSAVNHAATNSNCSTVGSSSTADSSLHTASSTSTSVHFIHLSNEDMKIKYDSESSLSQVKPKRKRGRPKKPEPTKPSSYEFIQDGWKNNPKNKNFVLFHLSSREYQQQQGSSHSSSLDNSPINLITFVKAENTSRSTTSYNPFDSISSKIASLKLNLYRLTFTGKQAPDTFDPESSDYWQGIGTIALGGGIVSVLSILALLFFDTIRGLGCFGGIEPTKQFFYGREQRKQPYGQCQTFSLKILLAAMLILVAGLCTLLIIGNVIFNVSFENGRVYFKSTLVDMFNTTTNLQTVVNRIQTASGSTSDITDITTLVTQQQTALNSTNTLVKEIRHLNFLRYFLLMVIACVMLSVPLLGLLSGLTHWKEFASYGVRFGYMMLVCAWILFTIHFSFAVVTQDMCATADRYLQGTQGNTTSSSSSIVSQVSSLVTIFAQCANSSQLVKNSGVSMSLVDGMLTSLNQQLTNADSQKRDFNLVLYNVTNATSIDFVAANPDTKASVQKSVDSILLFAYDLIPTFLDYNNCSSVGEKFVQFVDSGCVGMLSSIHILWAVFLIMGTALIPLTWFNCLGYKRFRKKRFVIPKERQPEGVEIALNLT